MTNPLLNTRIEDRRTSLEKDVFDRLDWLKREFHLNRAVDMALGGQYDEALAELSAISEDDKTSEIFSLQAKILAQKGQLIESKASWEKALEKDPNNDELQKGLSYVEHLAVPKPRFLFNRRLLKYVLIVLSAILVIGLISWQVSSLSSQLSGVSGQISQLAKIPNNTVVITPQIPENQSNQAPTIVDLEPVTDLITASSAEIKAGQLEMLDKLDTLKPVPSIPAETGNKERLTIILTESGLTNIKDVTAIIVDNKIQITFNDGLYQYGYVLRDRTFSKITSIGKALEPYGGKVKIHIRGNRSSGEGDDFINLEYLRAVVLGNYFIKNTGLSPAAFTFSGNNGVSPYPNDSWENIQRNKTCTIFVEID